jgi:hypothetical protein
MKYFSILALFLSSIAFSSERVTGETERAKLKPDSIRCTLEYDPTICTYLDISMEGTNRCFARAALQSYANAHNIKIDPAKVVCTSGV